MLRLLGGAVLVLVSACLLVVCRSVPCLAGPVVCALVPECSFRRLGGLARALVSGCPVRRGRLGSA